MIRITNCIFENYKSGLMSNATVLDLLQTFITAAREGITDNFMGFIKDVMIDGKDAGFYDPKNGLSLYTGVCDMLCPTDDGSAYTVNPYRLDIKLNRLKSDETVSYSLSVVAIENDYNQRRLIHFSYDFDKNGADIFCISECSSVVNDELEKLCNMFKSPYELMNGSQIKVCFEHFILNILYKYMLPHTLETISSNNLFTNE